jgi:hypothetical protein
MNRNYQLFTLSLQKKVTLLFAQVAIGVTGAPTLTANTTTAPKNKGILSIVRNSTGNYTLTMQDPYVELLYAYAVTSHSGVIPVAPDFSIFTHSETAPNAILTFQMSAAGVATDPNSGDTLRIIIAYGASTAQ